MKLILCALLALSCVILVTAAPAFWDDDDFNFNLSLPNIEGDCRSLGCPDNVASCSRTTRTTNDRNYIETHIVCTDNNGHAVRNDTTTNPNPNPGAMVQGYEFYGSYSGGNQVVRTNNDQVETFNKK